MFIYLTLLNSVFYTVLITAAYNQEPYNNVTILFVSLFLYSTINIIMTKLAAKMANKCQSKSLITVVVTTVLTTLAIMGFAQNTHPEGHYSDIRPLSSSQAQVLDQLESKLQLPSYAINEFYETFQSQISKLADGNPNQVKPTITMRLWATIEKTPLTLEIATAFIIATILLAAFQTAVINTVIIKTKAPKNYLKRFFIFEPLLAIIYITIIIYTAESLSITLSSLLMIIVISLTTYAKYKIHKQTLKETQKLPNQ